MDVKNIARKNEFLYGAQRVVFFEPFVLLIVRVGLKSPILVGLKKPLPIFSLTSHA